jgi:hypothetical protein
MGVEPTMASSSLPINGFEDRGGHRVSTTPTYVYHSQFRAPSQGSAPEVRGKHSTGYDSVSASARPTSSLVRVRG